MVENHSGDSLLSMRIDVVDIIKGIAIIMIVNVHLVSGPLFPFGETFHVIAFFFTAGIVQGMNEKWEVLSVHSFFVQRAKRLLYPYFSLSICYVVFRLCLNVFRGEVVFNSVISDALIQTVTFKGVGTLWFLPVLFLGELFFFIFKKKRFHDGVLIIGGVIIILISSFLNSRGICGLKWYNDLSPYGIFVNAPITLFLASIVAMMFVTIGHLSFSVLKPFWVEKNLPKNTKTFIFIVCVISFVIDCLFLNYYRGDLHKLNIGNPVVYLICSLTGLIFVCTISKILEVFTKRIQSYLAFFGRNSLIIMTTHSEYYITSMVFLVITSVSNAVNATMGESLISGLSLILILLVEVVIVRVINHTPLKYLYRIPSNRSGSSL